MADLTRVQTTARLYADALFRAVPAASLKGWSDWLGQLARLVSHPDCRHLATNPTADPAKVSSLLYSAVPFPELEQRPQAERFTHLLARHRQLDVLPEIAQQFATRKNVAQGQATAKILSAFPLDEKRLATLVKSLEHRFGRRLKPQLSVDPELIGGICVTVGDEVLDASVRTQLVALRTTLTQ
jgi:F-type H+-transporting ATPase subunit delta